MRRGMMQKSCSSNVSSKFDRTKTFESWLKKTKENKKYIFLTRFENGIPDGITLLNLLIGLQFYSIRFVYQLQRCGRTPKTYFTLSVISMEIDRIKTKNQYV